MIDDEQAKVALKAFFNIGKRWDLDEDDEAAILGQPDRAALRAWKAGSGPEPGEDTILRISHILAIFRAIGTLIPDRDIAAAWVKQPNAAATFDDRTALDLMADGDLENLKMVRQYLDAELQH